MNAEMSVRERKRSLEAGSKRNVILWSSVAAATAGIVAVAAIFTWKARTLSAQQISTRIRDVQDVLLDCESKIHEIKGHITEILPSVSQTPTTS
jgi:hypothetical protein